MARRIFAARQKSVTLCGCPAVLFQRFVRWNGSCNGLGVSIHISSQHPTQIPHSPINKTPVTSARPQATFSSLLSSIAVNKPVKRATLTASPTVQTAGTTSAAATPVPAAPAVPVSSSGTSLANLMAAASYAGVPYADLGQFYNSGSGDNWQQNMANALEARLQSVAANNGPSSQIYNPNPANDTVPIDLKNAKQFSSSAEQMQTLLNTMWSAVHAGNVSGYHTALQQLDSWYQGNGQQNYYTGLSDQQVAAFAPSGGMPQVDMPNANGAVAAATLAAITGKSTAATNLAAIAQSAITGTIRT
jgi:hypothetical protein